MDFGIVTSTSYTLKTISNSKIPSKSNSSCIYKVSCHDCNEIYVGETCDIKRRIYNHKYVYRNCNMNNAIFKHVYEDNHSVQLRDEGFEIISKILL